ncbi:hypothetical protein M427DRAFT_34278 [Gonapodya prolifera JEL478]|uniref:F-box domain-containing protein n=1 Tax=Gonapodya prolifera (strain JEL478) TaxID=1344416 RepID=A0A139A9F9_GONPJ|nr:hypothetical protein M427DRAFT_34278 [Gonapodya prolifera JEL478]|eukprot:KXS13033.1 hypothetical protein M427DRAFT_34278 [Gonapodya prolifera JEL478]
MSLSTLPTELLVAIMILLPPRVVFTILAQLSHNIRDVIFENSLTSTNGRPWFLANIQISSAPPAKALMPRKPVWIDRFVPVTINAHGVVRFAAAAASFVFRKEQAYDVTAMYLESLLARPSSLAALGIRRLCNMWLYNTDSTIEGVEVIGNAANLLVRGAPGLCQPSSWGIKIGGIHESEWWEVLRQAANKDSPLGSRLQFDALQSVRVNVGFFASLGISDADQLPQCRSLYLLIPRLKSSYLLRNTEASLGLLIAHVMPHLVHLTCELRAQLPETPDPNLATWSLIFLSSGAKRVSLRGKGWGGGAYATVESCKEFAQRLQQSCARVKVEWTGGFDEAWEWGESDTDLM